MLFINISVRTVSVKPYKTPKRSAISGHLFLTGHDADLDDFSIMSREPNRSTFKLLIRESLLIR